MAATVTSTRMIVQLPVGCMTVTSGSASRESLPDYLALLCQGGGVQWATGFKERGGLMVNTHRVYSDDVCPSCFFAERLLHGCTRFQAGIQRGRIRRVNELSYSPENPFITRLLTPFVNLLDLLT